MPYASLVDTRSPRDIASVWLQALLMIALGDDGDDAAMEPGLGVREPLTTTAL